MPNFRRKVVTVQAEQYFAGGKDIEGVVDGDPPHVMTTLGPRVVHDGDWVITKPGSDRRLMPPEAFATEYEAVEE